MKVSLSLVQLHLCMLHSWLAWRWRAGSNGIEQQENIRDQVSLAAEAVSKQTQEDIVPFTADFTELSGLPAESAATEAQLSAEPSSLQQAADTAEVANLADEGSSATLWLKAQRLLSWAMGCQHSAMSLAGMPMQLQSSAQLTGAGASADVKPIPQDTIQSSADVTMSQESLVSRPLKVMMMWGTSSQDGAQLSEDTSTSQPYWAQQAPPLMQQDGVVRPQKLSMFLQSLHSVQQANMAAMPAQAVQPQTNGLAWPQHVALLLQELPQALAGGISAVRQNEILADEQPIAVLPAGAQGATTALVRLQLPAAADGLGDTGLPGEEEQPSSKEVPKHVSNGSLASLQDLSPRCFHTGRSLGGKGQGRLAAVERLAPSLVPVPWETGCPDQHAALLRWQLLRTRLRSTG